MVFCTGAFFSSFSFFAGVAVDSGAVEDDEGVPVVDAVSDASVVSLGGVLSADSVDVSSAELLPAKNPLSLPINSVSGGGPKIRVGEVVSYEPVMLSSLISPKATASETLTNPDSESVRVALTTGSTAPRSVRLPIASATPTISASNIRVGNPLGKDC